MYEGPEHSPMVKNRAAIAVATSRNGDNVGVVVIIVEYLTPLGQQQGLFHEFSGASVDT